MAPIRSRWLIALVAGAVLVTPASATFPGPSGSIVFSIGRVLPDGEFDFDICGTAVDRRAPRRVTSSFYHDELNPAASADGLRLSFERHDVGSEGNLYLFIAQSNGRNLRNLRTTGLDPAWSPDGRQLVFSAGYLYLLDIATGRKTILFIGTGAHTLSGADWSPDGMSIAFTYQRGEPSAVYTIAADGSNLSRVVEGWSPSWSPDGSRIAFSHGRGDISTVRRDGSDVRAITEGSEMDFWPSWSPDGSEIAFVRVSGLRSRHNRAIGAETDIYVVSTTGGAPRNVTRSPFDEIQPSWAPRPTSSPVGATTPCTVLGTSRVDLLRGTGGPDVTYAGAGADVLRGGRENDLLDGETGRDLVDGGPGDDMLAGGAGADRLDGGSGSDSIYGGSGSDRIHARDRRRDLIDCGPSRDRVVADRRDRVRRNCERKILG